MSKSKTAKYKITSANITNDIVKKIVGKQVTVEKVKGGSDGDGGGKLPRPRQAPAWFIEFEKRNNQRLDRLENNVSNLRSDLNRVIKLNNLKH